MKMLPISQWRAERQPNGRLAFSISQRGGYRHWFCLNA